MDHVLASLDNFRQVARTRLSATEEASAATHALLFSIAKSIDPGLDLGLLAEKYAICPTYLGDMEWLLQRSLDPLGWGRAGGFNLHAGVAVRHAGGAIFQRAMYTPTEF